MPVVEGSLTAQALGRGEPVIVDDTTLVTPGSPVLAETGVRSSILVPIHGARPLGEQLRAIVADGRWANASEAVPSSQ